MTLGAKLAKLRKEQNYTQEGLAELLGVTRQSISRWELDVAYPETDKLIQLAKLYHCSLDYLLLEEDKTPNEESVDQVTSQKQSSKKTSILPHHKKTFFTSLWTVGYALLAFIFFALPAFSFTIYTGYPFFDSISVRVNLYDVISSSNYQLGNFTVLLSFLVMIAELIIIIVYYLTATKELVLVRIITAISAFVLMVFNAFFIGNGMIGLFFVILLMLMNVLGLFLLKFNKHSKLQ